MSDFNPGDGWREVTGTSDMDKATLVDYENHPERGWIRVEPVPPLPTEPYTVIDAKFDDGQTRTLVRWSNSWQYVGADRDGFATVGELDRITGFEVRAEPRAVTVKAVLKRVRATGLWQLAVAANPKNATELDTVTREFGASS